MLLCLGCNAVAKAIGSNHRCNKKLCAKKNSKNPQQTYSTKSEDGLKVLWALLCCKKNISDTEIINRPLLRKDVEEIEKSFWH